MDFFFLSPFLKSIFSSSYNNFHLFFLFTMKQTNKTKKHTRIGFQKNKNNNNKKVFIFVY